MRDEGEKTKEFFCQDDYRGLGKLREKGRVLNPEVLFFNEKIQEPKELNDFERV